MDDRERAHAFLERFRWVLGRDRQRADAWAAYMQDVLGSVITQEAALAAEFEATRKEARSGCRCRCHEFRAHCANCDSTYPPELNT